MGSILTFILGLVSGGSGASFIVWFLKRRISKKELDEYLTRCDSVANTLVKLKPIGHTFDDLRNILKDIEKGAAVGSPLDHPMIIFLINLVDQQLTTCMLLENMLRYQKSQMHQMAVLAKIEFEVTRMLVARAVVAALQAENKSKRVDFGAIDMYLASVQHEPLGLATITFLRANGSPEEEIEDAKRHYLEIFPFYDQILNKRRIRSHAPA